MPLSWYRDKPSYTMRTNAFDRFATPLEQQLFREQIQTMMREAGLESIRFRNGRHFWVGRPPGSPHFFVKSLTTRCTMFSDECTPRAMRSALSRQIFPSVQRSVRRSSRERAIRLLPSRDSTATQNALAALTARMRRCGVQTLLADPVRFQAPRRHSATPSYRHSRVSALEEMFASDPGFVAFD